ncbi:DUF6286 domain-containing protein [Amycolatopsis nigrescens]|uniref:DUF6286 domain-containing protein n=1 Tax=Amycolatopsis nigrescens TaxID=381445 RepID=UPI000366F82A|nr:DUF6286 domain-containing protein [Amycolatopsis nigrescens]
MIRRPRRSAPAVLVALVLLAGCVLVATAAIQYLVGAPPVFGYDAVAGAIHDTSWNEPPVLIAGGVAVLAGLVLLALAVLPGRPVVLPLAGAGDRLDSGATRRSMRSSLHESVTAVDGVAGAKLKLRRKKVAVQVRTHRTTTDGMADAVRGALEQRLDQIAPVTRPRTRVRVVTTRSSR